MHYYWKESGRGGTFDISMIHSISEGGRTSGNDLPGATRLMGHLNSLD